MKRYICASSEIAWIVTFGQDSGDAENGPIISSGEYLIYAISEDEACRKFEDEYAYDLDGYEGCWARKATQKEIDEWYSYMNEPEDLPFASQKITNKEVLASINNYSVPDVVSTYVDEYLDKCFFAEIRPEYDEALSYVANKVLEDLQNMKLKDIKHLVSKYIDKSIIRL